MDDSNHSYNFIFCFTGKIRVNVQLILSQQENCFNLKRNIIQDTEEIVSILTLLFSALGENISR